MRKNRLRFLVSFLSLLSTSVGGYLMIERGSLRPGLLMLIAGCLTALVLFWKNANAATEDKK